MDTANTTDPRAPTGMQISLGAQTPGLTPRCGASLSTNGVMWTQNAQFRIKLFTSMEPSTKDYSTGGNVMENITKLTRYLGRLMGGTTGKMGLTGLSNSLYAECSLNLQLIWSTGRENLLTTTELTKYQMTESK